MLPIRRAALRALQSSSPSTAVTQCTTRSFATRISTSTRYTSSPSIQFQSLSQISRPTLLFLRRTYATEESDDKSKLESAQESASEALDSAKEAASQAVDSAKETGYDALDQASEAASGAVGAAREKFSTKFPKDPSNTLYAGNLYFETSEETLRKKFEQFAPVKTVKIIYDGRGLSKGFGYVQFEDIETATRVRDEIDNQLLDGRRLAVQYAVKSNASMRRVQNPTGNEPFMNPPSKTLFIGNMSYEMTDKDLNDLFREIKNVLDVRVAIDRRTGQPRGFAHADFADIQSAEAAAEYLKTRVFYERRLKVDFSAPSGNLRRPSAASDPAEA